MDDLILGKLPIWSWKFSGHLMLIFVDQYSDLILATTISNKLFGIISYKDGFNLVLNYQEGRSGF